MARRHRPAEALERAGAAGGRESAWRRRSARAPQSQEAGRRGQVRRSVEQAVFDQVAQAHEPFAAGERRRAIVRRIAAAGRHDRQHLPQTLTGARQEAQELVRLGPEIAVTMRPR